MSSQEIKRESLLTKNKERKKRKRSSLFKKRNDEDDEEDAEDPQKSKERLAVIRQNLPVFEYKSKILELVKKHECLLVVAETGSGKSTQIPAYLYESALHANLYHSKPKNNHSRNVGNKICVTQPRRVAAITIAKRVAAEIGCRPGTVVGHRVRFDDFTCPKTTKLIYSTDGMLLREAATRDPLLSQYSIICLDEAHERSLQTDILFGVVKRAITARRRSTISASHQKEQTKSDNENDDSLDAKIEHNLRQKAIQQKLNPLHVIVMSATLNVQTFQNFFPQSHLIRIPGRMHPVQIVYTKEPQTDYLDAVLASTLQIHAEADEDGDILVFLPGQEEIENMASLLKNHLSNNNNNSIQKQDSLSKENVVQSVSGTNLFQQNNESSFLFHAGVLVTVLYAALPPEAQLLAFQPKPKGCRRKIILATNIAETSVTLDGIKYVVDCGKHKSRHFSSTSGMESLTVSDVSKAQAAQRTGRAGRVAAGICFRLYTEEAFGQLQQEMVPEIQRVNLAQVVLQLKGMGVHDPRTFCFLTPPSVASLERAFQLLYSLKALDDDMKLTAHGKQLARLPLDPIFGHLLLQSRQYACTSDVLTAVAMMSAENMFVRPNNNDNDDAAMRAAAAHGRFTSHEGDIPTLVAIYDAWQQEATMPHKMRKKRNNKAIKGGGKVTTAEWCYNNFISSRALIRAQNVRIQLRDICSNGLGMDVHQSSLHNKEEEGREAFFKAICAGLFLQSASRIQATVELKKNNKGNSGALYSSRGRYKTKLGGQEVSIHPTSSMFGRNPAPKCVVYTELLTTKKTYIRGVTQIREEWLCDVFRPSQS